MGIVHRKKNRIARITGLYDDEEKTNPIIVVEEKGGFLFIDKNRGQELKHLNRIVQYNAPSISSLNLTDNIQRFAEIINRQYEQIINGQSGKVA